MQQKNRKVQDVVAKYGSRVALDKAIAGVLGRLSERLPAVLFDTLREQWNGLENLDRQIVQIERRLQERMRQDAACKAIAAIPGVGLLTATVAVATMGYAKSFKFFEARESFGTKGGPFM